MVNTLIFVFSGVYLVVILWSSDIDGNDVLVRLHVGIPGLHDSLRVEMSESELRLDTVPTWVVDLKGVVVLSMAMIASRCPHLLVITLGLSQTSSTDFSQGERVC